MDDLYTDNPNDPISSPRQIIGDLISYQNDGKGCTAIADKVVRT